jgi:hypothetical protein
MNSPDILHRRREIRLNTSARPRQFSVGISDPFELRYACTQLKWKLISLALKAARVQGLTRQNTAGQHACWIFVATRYNWRVPSFGIPFRIARGPDATFCCRFSMSLNCNFGPAFCSRRAEFATIRVRELR